jgi:transcription initiation factor TFIIE subunit alpha
MSNKQVVKLLEEIVGKNGLLILNACDTKRGVTDEGIAKKTELKLPVIRSVLNQLHFRGLIRYEREKNPDTNWYTYTWFACKDKIGSVLRERFAGRLDELQQKFNYEANHEFFSCGNGCEKIAFELAGEYDFKCPNCGKDVQKIDNHVLVGEILQEMNELQELINRVA